MGSVFDRVMGLLGVREEEESDDFLGQDDEFESEVEVTSDLRRGRSRKSERESANNSNKANKANLVSLTGGKQATTKMVILEPETFDEVSSFVEHLKNKRSIIIRFDQLEREEARRIVDFMSGVTHALDGNMRKLGENIFCFAPPSVEIEGALDEDFDIGSKDH